MNPAYNPSGKSGSTIVVDETRAHGGKRALHARADTPGGFNAGIDIGNPVFPIAGNSFFLRAFVYYASPPGPDNIYLFRLFGVVPGTSTRVFAKYGVEGYPYNKPTDPDFRILGTLIYHSAIKSADHKAYRNPAGTKVPFDRWVCWELQVDGANGEWRAWLDGVEQFTRKWNNDPGAPWLVPQASRLNVGIEHPHTEPTPMEVWFDDLVIGTQRVGCGS